MDLKYFPFKQVLSFYNKKVYLSKTMKSEVMILLIAGHIDLIYGKFVKSASVVKLKINFSRQKGTFHPRYFENLCFL